MSKSGKITKGPFWSQNWFEAMWRFTCNNFVNFDTGAVDFEALGREEYEFRKALFFRNFKNSKRARAVFDEAKAEYYKKVENGMKGGRPKKNTEGAANGNNADCDHARESESTGSTTDFESLGSGKPKTQAQNDQRRAGGISPLSVSTSSRPPARSGDVDVLNLAYAGEFGNVRLTQEQYAQLGIKFGNQQKLNRAIDSLSCQLENGEKNPQNHYAELVKWASYRDDMEEKEELRASSAPHYETVSEHNARIVRESDAWIHEYCQQQKKNRKAANG